MSSRTTHVARTVRRSALPAMAVGLLALAGCGSGSGTSTKATAGSRSVATVTIQDDGGRSVLATSDGRTLYLSDQEHGRVLCTSGACEAIWTPLTVNAGKQPTVPRRVAADISTVRRPDGSMQVALDGRPLYTFSFDHGAGQVNGDGQKDSFDGTTFSWHAATPTGSGTAPAPSAPTTSPSFSGGYRY